MSDAQNTDPHAAADAYLASYSTFDLPTWEIPNLPTWSPFGPSLDAGVLEQYAPPPLPTILSIPTADALPAPSGAALTAGSVNAPPSAAAPTDAGAAPMLTQ